MPMKTGLILCRTPGQYDLIPQKDDPYRYKELKARGLVDENGFVAMGVQNALAMIKAEEEKPNLNVILTVPSGKLAKTSSLPPIASIWLRSVEIYMSVRFSIFAMAGC